MPSMIKTYREARKYLEGFIPFIIDHSADPSSNPLDRMAYLLKLLNDPQNKFPSVVISGTSGKGSTSYLISHTLTLAGYKTGLTLSPHLEHITERMQINNIFLSDKKFINLLNELIPKLETMRQSKYGPASYYEILLAMAFVLFAKEKVDIAVVEVGIEGKYDATNLINPLIFVLNNISLDHTQILGNTVYRIAKEATFRIKNLKHIGKIKPSVITGVIQPSIISLIEKRSRESKATLKQLNKDFNYKVISERKKGVMFDFSTQTYKKRFLIALKGTYQASNAAIALTTVRELKKFGFQIGERFLAKALITAVFPGRFEVLTFSGSIFILDGAHNRVKIDITPQ